MTTMDSTYREYRLDNGLLVALQKTPTRTVSGKLRIWHGTLNEMEGEDGLAHFLEHMLILGGSKKYTPKDVLDIVDRLGNINAVTDKTNITVPVDMLGKDTQTYLELVSDIAFNPIFDDRAFENEKLRVLRECADYKSGSAYTDMQEYRKAIFGENSQHIKPILGKEAVIQAAKIQDLQRFHARGFYPNNMDLILVGDLPKNIEYLIEENFGKYDKGNVQRVKFQKNQGLNEKKIIHTYAPSFLNRERPEESSAILDISFPAPLETERDTYATAILSMILGFGPKSRIFKKISQERGMAYDIGFRYERTPDTGICSIKGKIKSSNTNEAIDLIFKEMTQMRTELAQASEVEGIKNKLIYTMAKTIETNEGHLYAIERKIDAGITIERRIEEMNAVTPEMVREAAIKYLPENREDGKYVLLLRDPLKKE